MATRIGIVQKDDGTVVIKKDGRQGDVFELLAVLNANFLLETTGSPSQYREVFDKLQAEIASKYTMLLLDKVTTQSQERADDFDFLDA